MTDVERFEPVRNDAPKQQKFQIKGIRDQRPAMWAEPKCTCHRFHCAVHAACPECRAILPDHDEECKRVVDPARPGS